MKTSEEFQKYIMDNLIPALMLVGDDGKILQFSDAVLRTISDIAIGDDLADLFPGFKLSTFVLRNQLVLRSRSGEIVSVTYRQVNGSHILCLDASYSLGNVDVPKGESFHDIMDRLPIGIYEFDLNGTFSFCSKEAYRMFGFNIEDAVMGSLNVMDVIVPEERELATQRIAQLLHSGGSVAHEYVCQKKDGSRFPVEIHSSIITYDGKPVGLRGALIDLTAKKKADEEILKTNKLESLGVLAGGIAHDFNNILTIIIGNISLAKFDMDNDAETFKLLEEAESAGLKAKSLTQQLLSFSRGREPVKENSDIEEIVRQSAQFVMSGSKSDCRFSFPEGLWSVDVDRGQISRVVQNLVINAIQSMPGGGVIELSAHNVRVTASDNLPVKCGRYIRIDIADKGCGIGEENLTRIFDPYFTTKELGSGLGLSVAYTIVKSHRGHISVVSEKGVGTTISFYLPASNVSAEELCKDEDPFPGKIKMLNVLIIDDEEPLRKVAGEMVKLIGHLPYFASGGDEALAFVEATMESGPRIDVVLVDLTIPGRLTAAEIVRGIKNLYEVKGIVCSGYVNDPAIKDYLSFGFDGSMSKPFTMDELRKAINSVTLA